MLATVSSGARPVSTSSAFYMGTRPEELMVRLAAVGLPSAAAMLLWLQSFYSLIFW